MTYVKDIGMELAGVKVRREKFYAVGYDKEAERYILSVVISWVVWYKRYYEISQQEYAWFEEDSARLDRLAEECYRAGPFGDRFVCSEKAGENKQ